MLDASLGKLSRGTRTEILRRLEHGSTGERFQLLALSPRPRNHPWAIQPAGREFEYLRASENEACVLAPLNLGNGPTASCRTCSWRSATTVWPFDLDRRHLAGALDDEVHVDAVQARIAAALLGDAADQHLEVLRHHALHDRLIERLVAAAFGRVAEVGDVAELVLAALPTRWPDGGRLGLAAGGSTFIVNLDALHEVVLAVVHELL